MFGLVAVFQRKQLGDFKGLVYNTRADIDKLVPLVMMLCALCWNDVWIYVGFN